MDISFLQLFIFIFVSYTVVTGSHLVKEADRIYNSPPPSYHTLADSDFDDDSLFDDESADFSIDSESDEDSDAKPMTKEELKAFLFKEANSGQSEQFGKYTKLLHDKCQKIEDDHKSPDMTE